eukprot:1858636-Rhodomonas_salina.1
MHDPALLSLACNPRPSPLSMLSLVSTRAQNGQQPLAHNSLHPCADGSERENATCWHAWLYRSSLHA